jgi:hypothetical protein
VRWTTIMRTPCCSYCGARNGGTGHHPECKIVELLPEESP